MFENVEAFYRPGSVRDAVTLLQSSKGSARIVAGCTNTATGDNHSVRFLIDITKAGLSYMRRRGDRWAIGATTTLADLEHSPEIHSLAGGLLSRAAATCGSPQIRNMATVGGNITKGSAAADLATPLLALDAVAVIADATGRHRMSLPDYLAAARTKAIAKSLLVEVTFPAPPDGSRCGWSFQKFGRTAIDVALVNVAAGLQLDARGRVKWVRLALGAVAPAPLRMTATEELMVGHAFDRVLLTQACESVMRDLRPISDHRASADYRGELCRVLTGRALEECAAPKGCII